MAVRRTPPADNSRNSPPLTRLGARRMNEELQTTPTFSQRNESVIPEQTSSGRQPTGAVRRRNIPENERIPLSNASRGLPRYPTQKSPIYTSGMDFQGRNIPYFLGEQVKVPDSTRIAQQTNQHPRQPPPPYDNRDFNNLDSFIRNIVNQSITDTFKNNNQQTLPFQIDNISEYNRILANIDNMLPEFHGNNTLHPIDFLEKIKFLLQRNNTSFLEIKFLLAKKLQGRAKAWSEAYLKSFLTFTEFEEAYLRYFWSETKQLEIKLKIWQGKYETGSLVDHFTKYVAMAQYLRPPLSEFELIQCIARHFPVNIFSAIIGLKKLSEVIPILQQAEYYNHRTVDRSNFGSRYEKDRLGPERKNYANRNVSAVDLVDDLGVANLEISGNEPSHSL